MRTDVEERLKKYRSKRDFQRTDEPAGEGNVGAGGRLYVMHKHAASHDHFDLRLEQDGVLRSWALPKGPSLTPGEKRLAIEVEDHPLAYGSFEGVIPQGEYGGGTVMLWDAGSWQVTSSDEQRIDFELDGEKLRGAWTLVRMSGSKAGDTRGGKRQWLMIKRSDNHRPLHPDQRSIVSGRSMAEIARNAAPRKAVAPKRRKAPQTKSATNAAPPPARLNTHEEKLPAPFEPQLATLVETAPSGEQWLNEIKLDGYRLLAFIEAGKVRLYTRNQQDWSARFPKLCEALAQLPVDSAILDGEVIALLGSGASSFRHLQEALSTGKTDALRYYLFDLLHLDGTDLRTATQLERKQLLATLLDATPSDDSGLHYSEHIVGDSAAFHRQACQLGLEGIICKRADATYRSGRGKSWLKVKCTRHQEFLVGGFTQPAGSRTGFGALLLGAYEGDRLRYAGRVGTGFSTLQLRQLHKTLKTLQTKASPFDDEVAAAATSWVKPTLVVEVEFTERTRDGRLRHPVFRGIREDRTPEEIMLIPAELGTPASHRTASDQKPARRGATKQSTESVAGIVISHPQRVLYPEQGLSKLDLARYYAEVGEWMLPQLARRPLSLLRCPDSASDTCFYQKHLGPTAARQVPRIAIASEQGEGDYCYVETVSDIVALVQAGVLEMHPWGCHVEDIEHPDLLVFDLDPGPGVEWRRVVATARALRELLAELGLHSFARTTGGKGLHLVVPLKPHLGWDETKAFSRAVVELLASADPRHLTTNMAKASRKGRIFLDYLRNGRGSTAVASYSARARPGAPVAVPIRWEELNATMKPDRYRVDNLRRRLSALKCDPWIDFEQQRVAITEAMLKKVSNVEK